jgi:hypothetical protein
MNSKQIAFAIALSLGATAAAQPPANGGGNNQNPPNNNGQNNGQNPINIVPGFGDSGGGGAQVDPLARYLMVKDAYRNNNFTVRPPVEASARDQVDQDFFLKYSLAAFDIFDTYRKRIVNEQDAIVKTIKDADKANRREQDELAKDQALAAKRNALSRLIEAMNALPIPKNVVATGRPLNAYLDRVNQAGSFGDLLTVGSSEAFKLNRPEAIRVSSGVGERAVRIPIVGSSLPFNPPAFLGNDPTLKSKLEAYQQARQEAAGAKAKRDAVPPAQDALAALDLEVAAARKKIEVRRFHDQEYQDTLAWRRFVAEEKALLGWLAVNPDRETFAGKTVVDLLTYMRRNGYVFAKADPGDEDSYVALHQQLRDVCIKAGESPASGTDGRMEGFTKETDRLRERLPPTPEPIIIPGPPKG